MNKIKEDKISRIADIHMGNLKDMFPKHIADKFYDKVFLAGGAIYSIYNGLTPSDYDFFVTDKEFCDEIRQYVMDKSVFISDGDVKRGLFNDDVIVIVTNNAISFDGTYQIITRYIGSPSEVVGEFDFRHNMFFYYKGEVDGMADESVLQESKLEFNDERARDICGTIIRISKFTNRGMKIEKKEIVKMLRKLADNGIDEREKEILQTTSAY